MKKIIKPLKREEAVYYSDFTGKCFGQISPHVELVLDFGYGSINDGAKLKLDLTDDEVEPVLNLLKKLVNKNFKENIINKIKELEEDYDNTVQTREWNSCDNICNNISFWKKFLDIEEKDVD